jgi:ABC-type antimicrobial peptide transport system permease subunit
LILRRGLILVCTGIACGAVASFFAGRLLEELLFKVTPLDHWVFLTVTPILFITSIAASLVPALRAASLDPMRTLREQ